MELYPPSIDTIRERLKRREPVLLDSEGLGRGAVAVVLCDGASGPEVLLIERVEHELDPWSGHIAFPGGRVDPEDASERAAAERETREEIGLDLTAGEHLGRLDDVRGVTLGIRVSAFVYYVPRPGPLTPSAEVARVFGTPLATLTDPARRVMRTFTFRDRTVDLPAIDILGPGRPVLWGLTYRTLRSLIEESGIDAAAGESR